MADYVWKVFAPKGHYILAQGNAPGRKKQKQFSPERALQDTNYDLHCAALTGLGELASISQGVALG